MDWESIWQNVSSGCIDIAWKLLAAVLVLVIGSFLIRSFMKHFLTNKKSEKIDPTVRRYTRTAVKAGLNLLLVIMLIGILGVPMASIITVIGAAGAAVALALQGSLGNLASGIMLLIFRPFKIGQFIEVNGQSGTVDDLGLFYTNIITPDNKHVIIPNSTLTSATIINYSAEQLRRVDIVYNVAYGTDIEKVKKLIEDKVGTHSKVKNDPAPFIRMTEMSDSSINFTLRVWCDVADYWDVRFDLTEGVYNLFGESGIEIPFPQVDVHVKK